MSTCLDVAVQGLFATSVAACGLGLGPHRPALRLAGKDGASVMGAEIIRPKPGLPSPFASGLMRQVRPDRGSGTRISDAFGLAL